MGFSGTITRRCKVMGLHMEKSVGLQRAIVSSVVGVCSMSCREALIASAICSASVLLAVGSSLDNSNALSISSLSVLSLSKDFLDRSKALIRFSLKVDAL